MRCRPPPRFPELLSGDQRADNARRIGATHLVELLGVEAEGLHVAADQPDAFDRVWEQWFSRVARKRDVIHSDRPDCVIDALRIDTEQRRDLVVREVHGDADAYELLHLRHAQVNERAKRMVDHRFAVADAVDHFGQRVDLAMRGMAKEERHVRVRHHAHHVGIERLQLATLVKHVVAVLQRLFPRQRWRVALWITVRIHPHGASADLVIGICMVEDRQPDGCNPLFEVALELVQCRRFVVHRNAEPGPAADRRDAALLRPSVETFDHGLQRGHGPVFPRYGADRLVEDAGHAAFGCEDRECQRVLLTFVGVAVDVDRTLDTGNLRRKDHSRAIAAPGGVGGDTALVDGRRVLDVGHAWAPHLHYETYVRSMPARW